MTNILLDTHILIDVLRGFDPAARFLNSLEEHNISIFTCFELIKGAQNKAHINKIDKLIKNFQIWEIDSSVQVRALSVYKEAKLLNHIHFIDTLIAITAMENDFMLATKNTKHFKVIKNLHIHVPY